jgi:D-ribose pyranase
MQTLEAVVAGEIKRNNRELEGEIKEMLDDLPLKYIPHTEMKSGMVRSKGVIRTGDAKNDI